MANVSSEQIFRTPGGIVVPPVKWRLLLRNVDRAKPTLIVGETGTAKTSLAIEAGRVRGRRVEVIHFSIVFDPEATVTGTTQLRAGETRFVRSRFVDAILTPGCVIVIDEINRASGAAHNALLSLLDFQARLAVDTDDGERRLVALAPGVAILATANIGAEYVQTEPIDAALLSRMQFIRLEFPPPAEEQQLVQERGLEPREAGWLVRIATEIRKAKRRGELAASVSTRGLLEAAEIVREGHPVATAFESVVPVFDTPELARLDAIVRATK